MVLSLPVGLWRLVVAVALVTGPRMAGCDGGGGGGANATFPWLGFTHECALYHGFGWNGGCWSYHVIAALERGLCRRNSAYSRHSLRRWSFPHAKQEIFVFSPLLAEFIVSRFDPYGLPRRGRFSSYCFGFSCWGTTV